MVYGKLLAGVLAVVLCSGVAGAMPGETAVKGEYIEARTCNVWTGACFANGEMALLGKNAVVGWSVSKGSWEGVSLDGLKVVAALNSEGTLGTKYEGKVTSALYVDEKATCAQAEALVALAKALAPKELAHVIRVEKKAVAFSRSGIKATLKVGSEIGIKTDEICDCNSSGCTAMRFYDPVSRSVEVECAKAVTNSYQDGALGVRWSESGLQGAMLGTFSK
jgi:hypothetical protein